MNDAEKQRLQAIANADQMAEAIQDLLVQARLNMPGFFSMALARMNQDPESGVRWIHNLFARYGFACFVGRTEARL